MHNVKPAGKNYGDWLSKFAIRRGHDAVNHKKNEHGKK
jgi:hypothetical protein